MSDVLALQPLVGNIFSLTATPDDDFVAIEKQVILINSSELPHRLYIPIKNDECVEYDETFSVHIDSESDGVVFGDKYQTITIEDDDGKSNFTSC